MRRFYITEILIIVALVIGILIGRYLLHGDRGYYRDYYEKAAKAYQKAEKADTPPVSSENPTRLRKVLALYREVFDKYRDSRWADDALFKLASRMDPTEEESFALFRRLINDYPDSEWADAALYTIAMGHYRKESYDEALLLFDRVIKEYPNSHLVIEAEFNRAMCYYGKGNWKEALSEFDDFEAIHRDSKLVHSARFYRGMVFSDKQEYETARVEFQNIADAGFKDLAPEAQFNIGHTYFAEGEYDEAIAAYQKTINEYPNTKSGEYAEFYIGEALQKQGKDEEAIAQLEQAITKYPENEKAAISQMFIAEIYFKSMDDVGRAVEIYRKVADNEKYDYDLRREAQYLIGKIYEDSNQIQQAVEEYQKLNKEFQWMHSVPTHPSNDIDEGYIENVKTKSLGE